VAHRCILISSSESTLCFKKTTEREKIVFFFNKKVVYAVEKKKMPNSRTQSVSRRLFGEEDPIEDIVVSVTRFEPKWNESSEATKIASEVGLKIEPVETVKIDDNFFSVRQLTLNPNGIHRLVVVRVHFAEEKNDLLHLKHLITSRKMVSKNSFVAISGTLYVRVWVCEYLLTGRPFGVCEQPTSLQNEVNQNYGYLFIRSDIDRRTILSHFKQHFTLKGPSNPTPELVSPETIMVYPLAPGTYDLEKPPATIMYNAWECKIDTSL